MTPGLAEKMRDKTMTMQEKVELSRTYLFTFEAERVL